MTNSSGRDENQDQLTGHEYDGIEEYDNPLPRWWLWGFVGCILFAGGYYYHYTFGSGPSLREELARAMTEIETRRAEAHAQDAKTGGNLEDQIRSADLKFGSESFQTKCAACHGAELQGVIGPNLTDEFWIHGKGDEAGIFKIVSEGVPEKGMPTWSAVLDQKELVALTAYILSKQDSHPANPKAPQGEKVR